MWCTQPDTYPPMRRLRNLSLWPGHASPNFRSNRHASRAYHTHIYITHIAQVTLYTRRSTNASILWGPYTRRGQLGHAVLLAQVKTICSNHRMTQEPRALDRLVNILSCIHRVWMRLPHCKKRARSRDVSRSIAPRSMMKAQRAAASQIPRTTIIELKAASSIFARSRSYNSVILSELYDGDRNGHMLFF